MSVFGGAIDNSQRFFTDAGGVCENAGAASSGERGH